MLPDYLTSRPAGIPVSRTTFPFAPSQHNRCASPLRTTVSCYLSHTRGRVNTITIASAILHCGVRGTAATAVAGLRYGSQIVTDARIFAFMIRSSTFLPPPPLGKILFVRKVNPVLVGDWICSGFRTTRTCVCCPTGGQRRLGHRGTHILPP